MRALLIIPSLFLFTACATGLKKDCQERDWYQASYVSTMEGQSIDNDEEYQNCQKIGLVNPEEIQRGHQEGLVQYCQQPTATDKGLKGQKYLYQLCQANSHQRLKQAYQKGIRSFCTSKNGYKLGTEGFIYKDNCPKELKNKFLSEYRKGRRVYAKSQISRNTRTIQSLEQQIFQKKIHKDELKMRLKSIPRASATVGESFQEATVSSSGAWNPATQQMNQNIERGSLASGRSRTQYDRLQGELRETEDAIRSYQSQKRSLRQQNEDLQREL